MKTAAPSALRKRVYEDKELDQLARDVDTKLAALGNVKLYRKTVTAQYTEPMRLQLDAQPWAILAVRVRERDNPSEPVSHVVDCNFEWEPSKRTAKINDIDGMTANATVYVFDFLVMV